MVSDAQGVKAEIATRVNEKMSEVSNQYHRLVGTLRLEGYSVAFLSRVAISLHQPIRLKPEVGTCRRSFALQLWFRAAVQHVFASDFESTSTDRNPVSLFTGLLIQDWFCIQCFTEPSAFLISCSCYFLSSLTLCLTCLHALGTSATPVNPCPSPFHMLTTQLPPTVHTHHCVV